MGQKVAILGASDKPDRYSYKALKALRDNGHEPVPVSLNVAKIAGVKTYSSLKDIPVKIDTLTMYVNPEISAKLESEIISLQPKRVIFNPGSENPELMKALEIAGIHVVEACTLVLLRTKQFLDA